MLIVATTKLQRAFRTPVSGSEYTRHNRSTRNVRSYSTESSFSQDPTVTARGACTNTPDSNSDRRVNRPGTFSFAFLLPVDSNCFWHESTTEQRSRAASRNGHKLQRIVQRVVAFAATLTPPTVKPRTAPKLVPSAVLASVH